LSGQENRLGLVHRVLAARKGLREYAILVTDKRSVFIQLEKSRNSFLLRTEIISGTSGTTDKRPKTLDDYSKWPIGSLALEHGNFEVAHKTVTRVIIGIGGFFPVYHFNVAYVEDGRADNLVFYAVPLETYSPTSVPRPQEAVLREYAGTIFRLYAQVLPPGVMEDAGLGEEKQG
jgi:hypothetical protein